MQTNIYIYIYILFLDLCFEVKILTSETQTFVYPMMIEYFQYEPLTKECKEICDYEAQGDKMEEP
jgi:hypothetical protein